MKVKVIFQEECHAQKDLTVTKKLGCGKYTVLHVQGPAACEEYAVKVFPKSELNEACYKKEKDFLTSLNHPNIIRHFPVSKHDAEFDLLIMEYANHGDFFDIVTKGGLTHDVYIRTYFHQLIAGLEYLHQKQTAHLDLKLENLLLSQDFQLKIIDFEQSQSQGEERLTAKGTNSYRPPEIKNKTCTDKFAADIYSAGIVLYAFKACQFPFYEPEHEAEMEDYDLFVRNNSEFWKMKTQKNEEEIQLFRKGLPRSAKGHVEPRSQKEMDDPRYQELRMVQQAHSDCREFECSHGESMQRNELKRFGTIPYCKSSEKGKKFEPSQKILFILESQNINNYFL